MNLNPHAQWGVPQSPVYRRFGNDLKQLLRTMKISALFLFISLLHVAAMTKAQQITLHLKDAPFEMVMEQVHQQSGYGFLYNTDYLRNAKPVTVNLNHASISEALAAIFSGQPFTYEVNDNSVVIRRRTERTEPEKKATPDTVRGIVTDLKGTPLPGTTVRVKGTSRVTVTDMNGRFMLIGVPENSILIFSYTGYEKQETTIPENRYLHIKLLPFNGKLDEVNVIAYGTTTARLTTSSISKVSASEIEQQPITNPVAALQGRVPGLTVTQANGLPGANFRVTIEGQNALSTGANAAYVNSEPLYVVDGVPLAANNNNINQLSSAITSNPGIGVSPLNSINPADIESIEVLRDADATAIYGSRGAYGVILITTKKGKAGKTQADFTVNTGLSTIDRTIPLLNTQQYLLLRNEAFKNDGVTPDATSAPDIVSWDPHKYTDWEHELIGNTAHNTDASGTISGGSEGTQFLMGGSYHHESTVFPFDKGYDRGAFHVSINHRSIDKKFTSTFTALYSSDKNQVPTLDLTGEIYLPPNYPALKDGNGHLLWQYDNTSLPLGNPLADAANIYTAQTTNLVSNLLLGYQIIPGFTLKASLGYNALHFNENYLVPAANQDPQYSPQGYSETAGKKYDSWIIEPQAQYTHAIAKGILDILVGSTWQSNQSDGNDIFAYGYSSDNLLGSIASASSVTASNTSDDYRYTAVFGRINYNWDDRYIIDLTGRRDGSSRFGTGKRFGTFGAAGAAWLFSNESFFKEHLHWLSFGKLRGSFGITGSDQIGDYQYLDSWSSTRYTYDGTPGLYPTRLANNDYSWETNRKISAGIDLGFMHDRVLLSVEYYHNRSSNHLINYALPTQTGFTSVLENFPATIQNTGWQFTVQTKNISATKFSWQSSLNVTVPHNKLASFPGLATSSYASTYVLGQPLSVVEGYQYTGVNRTTGVAQFKDVNNDGVLNASDYTVLGNTDPKFYGGLGNTFSYGPVTLNLFFEFRKQMGWSGWQQLYAAVPGSLFNEPAVVQDRWRNAGDAANFQKATATPGTDAYQAAGTFSSVTNSAWLTDASFIRLKNVSVSCKLPSSWTHAAHLASARIFALGQNLFTITGYKGFDPETQSYFILPPMRTITAGIQLTL